MTTPERSRRAPVPVLRRWFVEGRRTLIGWAIGIVAVTALYLPLFPSMQTPELSRLVDSLPAELVRTIGYDDITSGAGYTQATVFGLIGFVLLTIAAIAWGAAVIGGAEESGRLELTLAHGVGRVRYALESAGSLVLRLAVLGVVAFLAIAGLNGPSQLGLEMANLGAATTAWVSLALLSGAAALAAGAAGGRRSWGLGAGAGIAVLGYVFQALANNGDRFEWLRAISPYDWAYGAAPLTNGADWAGLALLWLGSALLIAAVTGVMARRDVLG